MRLPDLPRQDMNVHLSFGGVALLLVLLILITPALENGSTSPSGPLFSRGEIFVDYLPNSTFTLYVESYGHVRFSSISIAINTTANNLTTGSRPQLLWNLWQNSTDRLDASLSVTNTTDFVVNVTTVYESSPPITITTSYGEYGFMLGSGSSGLVLTAIPLGNLPATGPESWPVSQLPQALLLEETSSSGVKA